MRSAGFVSWLYLIQFCFALPTRIQSSLRLDDQMRDGQNNKVNIETENNGILNTSNEENSMANITGEEGIHGDDPFHRDESDDLKGLNVMVSTLKLSDRITSFDDCDCLLTPHEIDFQCRSKCGSIETKDGALTTPEDEVGFAHEMKLNHLEHPSQFFLSEDRKGSKCVRFMIKKKVSKVVKAKRVNPFKAKKSSTNRKVVSKYNTVKELPEPQIKNLEDINRLLLSAVISNDVAAVKMLLQTGANANAANQEDRTPLFDAVFHDNLEMTELLLQHGADPNHTDSEGRTPLFEAPAKAGLDIVSLLIRQGAKVEVNDYNGESLLNRALLHSRSDIVNIILDPLAACLFEEDIVQDQNGEFIEQDFRLFGDGNDDEFLEYEDDVVDYDNYFLSDANEADLFDQEDLFFVSSDE